MHFKGKTVGFLNSLDVQWERKEYEGNSKVIYFRNQKTGGIID